MTAEAKNSLSFSQFIELLMQTVPADRPIVLVLDNASYHRSHVGMATLAYFEHRALAFWLPPYCSELNPIERFWRHLKETACANRLFRAVDELVDSVDKVLTNQNDLARSDRFLFTKT